MTDEPDWAHDLLRAIGRVTYESSRMEFTLAQVFAKMIMGENAELVAFGVGWRQALTGCRALLNTLPAGSMRDNVEYLFKLAELAYERRNSVVHGMWITQSSEQSYTVRMRYWGKRTVETWSVERVEQLAVNMAKITAFLERLLEHIENAAQVWPQLDQLPDESEI